MYGSFGLPNKSSSQDSQETNEMTGAPTLVEYRGCKLDQIQKKKEKTRRRVGGTTDGRMDDEAEKEGRI
jgi:hypothetical protein